jgi:hypothetical protein
VLADRSTPALPQWFAVLARPASCIAAAPGRG